MNGSQNDFLFLLSEFDMESTEHIKSFDKVADMIEADRRILVSRTNRVVESDDTISCNLDWVINKLSANS